MGGMGGGICVHWMRVVTAELPGREGAQEPSFFKNLRIALSTWAQWLGHRQTMQGEGQGKGDWATGL